MTKTQAHALLDRAKAGEPTTETSIRIALQATGDYPPDVTPLRVSTEPMVCRHIGNSLPHQDDAP